MPLRVAFLGLGHLGGGIADHALRRGVAASVYDPEPAAVAPRVAAGARAAVSPADAASDADVVCVVVRDDGQAMDCIAGPGGVLETLHPGGVVVLHATVAPGTVRALDVACRAAGARFVDVAIGAGAGRETGEMFAMCGGDPATIDDIRPVLATYCKHIVRYGDVGAGMAVKLARNLVQYSMWAVIHEGITLAEAAGIDRAAFAELFRASGVTASHDNILQAPPPGQAPPGAAKTVTLAWKDLDDAFALADEHGVAVPLARLAKRAIGPSVGSDLVPGEADGHGTVATGF